MSSQSAPEPEPAEEPEAPVVVSAAEPEPVAPAWPPAPAEPVEGSTPEPAEETGPEEPETAAAQSLPDSKDEVPTEATSADSEGPSEDEFVAWVQQWRRDGEAITGSTAGAFLGVSERTGRNRIKELRAARPELFEEDAA